ncbi:hypothetical protein L226DRAFT_470224, partial [Lentinus tigrinus ALCF2SS1-7]|uniref:uncharacterized protein n=1 Tax=Lentinus tigrinus ALCF2SS1-7 TaxID=1328758 RepID=UPI001165FC9C
MWKSRDLREIAAAHDVPLSVRDTAPHIWDKLLDHVCTSHCPHTIATFTTLAVPRSEERISHARPLPRTRCPPSPTSYLPIVDEQLRRFIIEDWQRAVTTDKLKPVPCSVCARRTQSNHIITTDPSTFDLTLLRNDALPRKVLPTTYDFPLYDRAILYPRGMHDPWSLAPLDICCTCHKELVDNQRMPKLCLANWLYYAMDELPDDVARALRASTFVDRLLISRARSTRISFRFNQADDHTFDEENLQQSSNAQDHARQRYIKGNVLVMPQNSTQFNNVLPPSPSHIRDTICAIFVGRSSPTTQTIKKLRPLLARKSTVQTLITFLINDNPYYQVNNVTFFGFSETNLDALLPSNPSHPDDPQVPSGLEIGFLPDNDTLQGSSSDYTHHNSDNDTPTDPDSLLMDNVGFTSGDESPLAYRQMKMCALSHCLNNGNFLCSKAGDQFVPDFHNPALLTWLFPHLNPWGIGSFHHPQRTVDISMEEQLRYLLELNDPRFESDPDFAFVYYNILQKKSVCDSVRFRVKAARQREIVASLLSIDRIVLKRMIAAFEHDPFYQPSSADELQVLALVDSTGTVLPNIPGTTGYKLSLRNEIRGLVNFLGTPAFFLTLNPSDIHHPLVRLFAGDSVSLEDGTAGEQLASWERRLLAANRPGACARFFHTMLSHFIDIVLRYGKPDRGLLG